MNLHETGGGIIPHIYEDEDKDPNTVTVTSNKFSVYSLVYKDTRKPDDDANFFVITAKAGEGGSVSPEGTVSAPQGSNQTFTITPEDGYEVADVLVDGQSVGAVERYTFERVNKSHTLRAVFQKAGTGWNPFEDVAAGDWFHDSVKALYERGLMAGTTPTRFSPDLFTSRAMLATILWRQAGQPAGGDALFPDVDPDSYYAKAVAWANGKGIFLGYDDGLFRPDALITREQLAAVLYREAGSPETAGMALGEFADGGAVSGWARQAMLWAVQQGIVTGRDNGTLDPGGNATRAETAAMLQRYWNY